MDDEPIVAPVTLTRVRNLANGTADNLDARRIAAWAVNEIDRYRHERAQLAMTLGVHVDIDTTDMADLVRRTLAAFRARIQEDSELLAEHVPTLEGP